jgi:hypothetical protein
LAIIRGSDISEIKVTIPDNYFSWLYAGGNSPLLRSITLVNQKFRKTFSGGFIKAIGGDLSVPTRSLPLLIGRFNPRNSSGLIEAKEELKPGMYCEVLIDLHEIERSFLIPYDALQEGPALYVVKGNNKLHIIEDFKILHQSGDGIIITLPNSTTALNLVSHRIRGALEGMDVVVEAKL